MEILKYLRYLPVLLVLACGEIQGQPDPLRFKDQIDELVTLDRPAGDLILFTGSSSIRFWKDLKVYFPGKVMLNHGFGGSTMRDLQHYLDELVIKYQPKQLFIYEGDNDIASGLTTNEIMRTTRKVIRAYRRGIKDVDIVIIAAKPSLARWDLKSNYEELNLRFQQLAARKRYIAYADVWTVMLQSDGTVRPDIFIDDGLHMNKVGYDLWADVIRPFIQ